jgi:hypothetical protein
MEAAGYSRRSQRSTSLHGITYLRTVIFFCVMYDWDWSNVKIVVSNISLEAIVPYTVTPCILVQWNQSFGEIRCLYLKFLPWKFRQLIYSKHLYRPNSQHFAKDSKLYIQRPWEPQIIRGYHLDVKLRKILRFMPPLSQLIVKAKLVWLV